jgi:hypothetical protein
MRYPNAVVRLRIVVGYVMKGCVGVGFLAAMVSVALYCYQNKIMYIPDVGPSFPKLTTNNPRPYRSPASYNRHGNLTKTGDRVPTIDYEEEFVKTSDGVKVHTWLMHHTEDDKHVMPTLVSPSVNFSYFTLLPTCYRFTSTAMRGTWA